jgi:NTE family protein
MEVGLVLGGGGARGFAHIGVLRSLAERGIKPVVIAGCSMGGIVGALYAAGHTHEDIPRMFDEVDTIKMLALPKMGALIGGKGIAREMEKHLPKTFQELEIPLAVTAVDVQDGVTVVLNEGPLIPALRATSALPGIFSPVDYRNRILVDGGLLNNVPIDVARTMSSLPMIAVPVGAPADRRLQFHEDRGFWDKIKEPFTPGKRPLVIELFMKAFDIPASIITEMSLTFQRPEVVIRPKLHPDLKVEDFKRMEEAIEEGYKAAEETLPGVEAELRAFNERDSSTQ